MSLKPEISIVIPVYLAENILPKLISKIEENLNQLKLQYEIILVDDRSPDGSWAVLKKLSEDKKHLKIIRLSRNFGQHPAITAGLSKATGKWVVVMDCDLQDQPKEVLRLYNETKKGYDVVLAKRVVRNDSFLKRLSSKAFSFFYQFLTKTDYDYEVANFGIYHSKVIKAILSMGDSIKFFPLFVKSVGFNTTAIEVEHAERDSGDSTYNLKSLIQLALNTVISFSNRPLQLFVKLGLYSSSLSFLGGIIVLIQFYRGEIKVLGYSSLIISIWFLSGLIISCIGVCGIYIGKIFDQVKNRPIFIIDEEI